MIYIAANNDWKKCLNEVKQPNSATFSLWAILHCFVNKFFFCTFYFNKNAI